jgi:septal ring factor EnvC (AmiA/AmiB activator)
MNDFDTGWDPYDVLVRAENNIHQLAIAFNQQSELSKQLAASFNHQQEVIQQLMFQNKRLHRDIERINTELLILKSQLQ